MAGVEIYKEADAFTSAVLDIREHELEKPLVAKLGGGVLQFSAAVFPESDDSQLYANVFERTVSIGPHFDVYGDLLDEKYPWVGVYNLSGYADVASTPLPEKLASVYREMYPERTDEAGEARRHFGALALENPRAEKANFVLAPGMGMVLPQRPNGVEVIHDVQPRVSTGSTYGKYIKIVRPKIDENTLKVLTEDFHYKALGEVVTEALAGSPEPEHEQPGILMPLTPHTLDHERELDVDTTPARRRAARRGLPSRRLD